MEYRDPVRENLFATMRSDSHETLISKEKDIRKKKFDFISHQGPPRKIDSDPLFNAARNNKGPKRDWHLLSHLKHSDHREVPIR
jgi:hypothetical protein